MLLTDKSKARRHKLNNVNIKVTFIAWLIEFVASFTAPLIPKVFGHGQVELGAGLILVSSFYFILLPFAYLINDSDIKRTIVDESWLYAVKGIFQRSNVQVLRK